MSEEIEQIFDDAILVRYDKDLGRFVYDIGSMDPWAAYAGLQQVVEEVWESLPEARTSDWVEG